MQLVSTALLTQLLFLEEVDERQPSRSQTAAQRVGEGAAAQRYTVYKSKDLVPKKLSFSTLKRQFNSL